MRRAVGKPISDSDLVGCTRWLNENGIAVRWFMIAGLPGERDDDWEAIRCSLQQWKRDTQRGTLGVSFTAWLPEPATPLGSVAVDDSYWGRWEQFREWFFGGRGWSNRLSLMSPAGPMTRMAKACLLTGLTESALRRGGAAGPNARVCYPRRQQAAAMCASYRDRTL